MRLTELEMDTCYEILRDRAKQVEWYGIYKKLMSHFKETKDAKTLTYITFYKTRKYMFSGKVEKLFDATISLLTLCEGLGDDLWLKRYAYNTLGIASDILGNPLSAVDYYWKQLDCLSPDANDQESIRARRYVYINTGCLYLRLFHYKKALIYFRMAEKIKLERENDVDLLNQMSLSLNFLNCYVNLGQYKSAQNFIKKIRKLLQEHEIVAQMDYRFLIRSYQYYVKVGCMAEASEYLQKILHYRYEKGSSETLIDLINFFLVREEFEHAAAILQTLEKLSEETNLNRMWLCVLQVKLKYLKLTNNMNEYRSVCAEYYHVHGKLKQEERKAQLHSLNTYVSLKEKEQLHKFLETEQEILRRKSEHDELTDLPNRYRIKEYCSKVFADAAQKGINIALGIVDVDFFKQYNDTYGHPEGDKCLRAIADEIKKSLDKGDLGARYGGDEFLIVRIGKSDWQIRESAERLRKRVVELALLHSYSPFLVVTISQGIVNAVPEKGQTFKDFLRLADQSLYQGKKKERNMVVIHSL